MTYICNLLAIAILAFAVPHIAPHIPGAEAAADSVNTFVADAHASIGSPDVEAAVRDIHAVGHDALHGMLHDAKAWMFRNAGKPV